ncbi:MAG: DNA alkylation repair protein [Lachnospiraceae bacterium]|jgi:3-methyladenine DNA glycosylase AlkD
MDVLARLFELQDKEYAAFQAKLTPGVPIEKFIGVRVPSVRKIAAEYVKESMGDGFLESLPHEYYDENMLHGIIISKIKDYEECIRYTDLFLPYVDNWAVCDVMSPVVFKKHRGELIEKIREWAGSSEIYTCRFGIKMLMSHFLDEDFKPEYLEIPASVSSDEYYVRMMVAWFFATALAKQWDAAVAYLEQNRLDAWTHNKTIQKARESYRIRAEQKDYLKKLKKVKKVPGTK